MKTYGLFAIVYLALLTIPATTMTMYKDFSQTSLAKKAKAKKQQWQIKKAAAIQTSNFKTTLKRLFLFGLVGGAAAQNILSVPTVTVNNQKMISSSAHPSQTCIALPSWDISSGTCPLKYAINNGSSSCTINDLNTCSTYCLSDTKFHFMRKFNFIDTDFLAFRCDDGIGLMRWFFEQCMQRCKKRFNDEEATENQSDFSCHAALLTATSEEEYNRIMGKKK